MEAPKTFANNFWGKDDTGYTRLVQRMHHAKQTCEEVQSFYKERQAIEEEYAKRLLNLSRKALGETETGSLRESLNTLRSTTAAMAKTHEAEAKQISAQLLKPLQEFAASLRERRRQSENSMARITKTKNAQNTTAEKSRHRYEQESHNITGYLAQQNLLMGRELDKNNAKLEKSRMVIDWLQRQYRDDLQSLSETIDQWNREWKNTCDKFQGLEEERIDFLKSNLWAYANVVSSVCVSDDEGCEVIRVALEKCEVAKDIADFIETNGTGSHIQDPPEFCNFMGGFSREDGEGTYRVANFTRDGAYDDTNEEEPHHDDESAFDTTYYRSQSSEDHSASAGGMKNIPDLVPANDEGYASSSPSALGMSPHSSMYSDSIGGSPQFQIAEGFNSVEVTSVSKVEPAPRRAEQTVTSQQPSPAAQQTKMQKRRSWAMPFKRQSSPDLSRIWKPTDSGSSSGSVQFYDAPQRHSDIRQAPPSTLSNAAQDPLLAAVERLKAESATTKPPRARPMSMPGINALHQQSNAGPYGNGRATADRFDSSVSRKSPSRKEVGTGFAAQDPAPALQSQPMRYHMQQAPPPQQPQYHQFQQHRAQQSQYPAAQQQAAPQQQQQRRPRSKSTVETRDSQMQLPSRASNGMRVIRYSRAQYDYRAAIPEEVSFRKGDILLVTAMQEDGWWEVEVLGRNRFGLAPSNFLVSV